MPKVRFVDSISTANAFNFMIKNGLVINSEHSNLYTIDATKLALLKEHGVRYKVVEGEGVDNIEYMQSIINQIRQAQNVYFIHSPAREIIAETASILDKVKDFEILHSRILNSKAILKSCREIQYQASSIAANLPRVPTDSRVGEFAGVCYVCRESFRETSETKLNEVLAGHFRKHNQNECLDHLCIAAAKQRIVME